MSKTQKTKPKKPPVAEFKSGPILAAVWLRATETGMSYLDFTLERLYKPKNAEKWQRSRSYFSQHADAIAEVADQARDFIEQHRDNPEAAAESVAAERTNRPTTGFAQQARPEASPA